jgi:hypothetical protein
LESSQTRRVETRCGPFTVVKHSSLDSSSGAQENKPLILKDNIRRRRNKWQGRSGSDGSRSFWMQAGIWQSEQHRCRAQNWLLLQYKKRIFYSISCDYIFKLIFAGISRNPVTRRRCATLSHVLICLFSQTQFWYHAIHVSINLHW